MWVEMGKWSAVGGWLSGSVSHLVIQSVSWAEANTLSGLVRLPAEFHMVGMP